MSKYYKAEDVERLIENICDVVIGIEEPIETSLSELPTIEVSEDCISREWLYNELNKVTAETLTEKVMITEFYRIINDAPSVVPKQVTGKLESVEISTSEGEESTMRQPKSKLAPTTEQSSKVGEWIKQGISPYEGIQRCSLCDEIYNITEEFNYCPNCGAKMKV